MSSASENPPSGSYAYETVEYWNEFYDQLSRRSEDAGDDSKPCSDTFFTVGTIESGEDISLHRRNFDQGLRDASHLN